MPSRFVLNELDVNLPPLAPGLVIIIVVVVSSSAGARTLDTSIIAIAIAGERVVGTGAVVGSGVLDVGHGRESQSRPRGVVVDIGLEALG